MTQLQNELSLGDGILQLTTAGDAILFAVDGPGEVIDLTEARGMWEESGGDENEWRTAVSYVDSLR